MAKPRTPRPDEEWLLKQLVNGCVILIEWEKDAFYLTLRERGGREFAPPRKHNAGSAYYSMTFGDWIEKTRVDKFKDVYEITQAGREALSLCV